MGKPYKFELEALADTYRWAKELPIDRLATAVAAAASFPLVAVGSGGSFTAAHFAGSLHQEHTGLPSKAVTPLEFVSGHINPRETAVLVLSASGNNADIVGCFKNAIMREPARCLAVCLREASLLSRTAAKFDFVDLIESSPPTRQDGFLATNSLLALVVLLSRAYARAFSTSHGLPDTFLQLIPFGSDTNEWQEDLRHLCRPLWQKDTLLVLFSPALHAAALDIESKFSEAALGTTQLADFHNFAHGRHNWLAKRGDSTAVLALLTKRDHELATKTLALLPKAIPIASIEIPTTTVAAESVAAIAAALHIVGCAGEARSIDPGRPGVPKFGRRIYNLRATKGAATIRLHECTTENLAIARKLGRHVASLSNQPKSDRLFWQNAFRAFVRSFDRLDFQGIVLDYDGTLCEVRDRFSGVGKEIAGIITHLIKKGVGIGIATGRGKSVRHDLQEKIPRKYWEQIFIGYYNGSLIGKLREDDVPGLNVSPTALISNVASAVEQHPVLGSMTSREPRHNQLSLQPKIPGVTLYIWKIAEQLIQSFPGVRAVISSHSVDLLGPGVSKRQLVERLQEHFAGEGHIMTVGDKGAWPGNDSELLSLPHSLSVDEVSTDPKSCWNLAPVGHRGPQAALDYLLALRATKAGARFDCAKFSRRLVTERDS